MAQRFVGIDADRRPQISDLSESGYGMIEKEANMVMFLHLPDSHLDGEEGGVEDTAELIIDKQRSSPTKKLGLRTSISQVLR